MSQLETFLLFSVEFSRRCDEFEKLITKDITQTQMDLILNSLDDLNRDLYAMGNGPENGNSF